MVICLKICRQQWITVKFQSDVSALRGEINMGVRVNMVVAWFGAAGKHRTL